jgi:hypothetical protein
MRTKKRGSDQLPRYEAGCAVKLCVRGRMNATHTCSAARSLPPPRIIDALTPGTTATLAASERMGALSDWPGNRLLLALPSRDLKQLRAQLEQIPCRRQQVLIDADGSLDHVYFPDSGLVSVVAVYSDGSIIEMATIGREGCTAVQTVFGAKTSSARFFVQIPGSATKMTRDAFTRAMRSKPSFRRLTFAYVQAFLAGC